MRNYDKDEAERLNAEPWQTELLSMNPDYTFWGPHEDYMINKGDGWNSSKIFSRWGEFGPWGLDELNECVHFYFSVERDSKECHVCGGDGYHPDAHKVVNGFYAHMNDSGEHWNDKITQDEVQALVDAGRLSEFTRNGKTPSAEEVNSMQNQRGCFGHDCINRSILVEARLKRLGLPKTCVECDGHGYVFTSQSAKVSLTLWMLHPRKGCSRGVEISEIIEHELPEVFSWLNHAAVRNSERFGKIPAHFK